MKAAVIGTNWGRVHVGGLRQAGCEVTTLLAHDAELVARIAAEEQIPCHGTDPALLHGVDLVTIATPTDSHLGYLRDLTNPYVLCEKPLGLMPDNQHEFTALPRAGRFISYPFPFLDGAQAIAQQVRSGALGPLTRATLVVGVNLPYAKTPVEWFLEDVVHPFSLLYCLFERFEWLGVRFAGGNNLTVQMRVDDALLDIMLCDWPKPGLHFDLTLVGQQDSCQLRGGFRPNRGWWMEPLMVDDLPVTDGEPAEQQIWLRANQRVVATLCSHLRGELTLAQAQQAGLYDLERAYQMEALFLPLWQAGAQQQAKSQVSDAPFSWT